MPLNVRTIFILDQRDATEPIYSNNGLDKGIGYIIVSTESCIPLYAHIARVNRKIDTIGDNGSVFISAAIDVNFNGNEASCPIKSIFAGTFSGCEDLLAFDISACAELTEIGASAFENCRNLFEIYLPKSLTTIGASAFKGCTSLAIISFANDNPNFCTVDNVLYNKTKTELICCPAGKTDTSFTVPASVNKIDDYAFWGCANLETLTILNPNIEIGANAFNGTSIKNLYVPSKATLKKFGYDESKNEYTGNSGLKPEPSEKGSYNFKISPST